MVLSRGLGAVAALLAVVTAAGPAGAEEPTVPGFDLGSCPAAAELPAGAEPAAWRCEAMVATGELALGRLAVPIERPMSITFAEGDIDGEFHQVFGAMTAPALPVPGTPWRITPAYAGYSDFESDDQRRGELDLTFRISGFGVRPGCAIGTEAEPVHLVLRDTRPTSVVSPDPLVVAFGVEDREFAAPATSGCGVLGPVLDRVMGLPSPAGANGIALDAQVALRSYTELP